MIFDYEFAELGTILQQAIKDIRTENRIQAVGMFDLTGSTSLKSLYGHEFGTKKALQALCDNQRCWQQRRIIFTASRIDFARRHLGRGNRKG